ncbi:DoxX family membrane protein [Granulicella sp. 5B5]|uniref:DoxX family protein n=1 Tax=Granulicella sp. 5B5 TaxID=1617967 RepID=UPI0015F5BBE2|nr:DoxX family membrane protein [Granulicella sp. 5B5]QMV19248.1 DoxX family membrane protein [Granulicella sp. 5B5]
MRAGRLSMGLLFLISGTSHFLFSQTYQRIIPPFLPDPHTIVLLSGLAEIAGGLGVILPGRRRAAAWGLACMLVAVFPANIYMAIHPELFPQIPGWLLWFRLPLQVPLIWWAYRYTQIED